MTNINSINDLLDKISLNAGINTIGVALLNGEIFRGGYVARGTKVLEKLPIKTIDFTQKTEKDIHDKIASL